MAYSRYCDDPIYFKYHWKRIFESIVQESKKLIGRIKKAKKKGLSISEISKQENLTEGHIRKLLRHGFNSFTGSIKRKVKSRDKNQCTFCRTKDKLLHVHHLGHPFNHLPNNLITLCGSCHIKIEGWCKRNNLQVRFKD